MDAVGVVALILIGSALVTGLIWLVRRHQHVKAIEALGWQWDASPGIQITHGLNSPPFGVGFSRRADHLVVGTSKSGTGFQAFRYRADGFSSSGYVLTMRLPHSLPEFYAFPAGSPRTDVSGQLLATSPLTVVAPDPAFGNTVLIAINRAISSPPVNRQGKSTTIDVSIDHDRLVAVHTPRKPEELAAAVEWLAGVHSALTTSPAMSFRGPRPPPHLSFHGRNHWRYIPHDDAMLRHVNHSVGGHSHQALDIITSHNFGLPFIRLEHKWETTETSTDSEGRTRTHTERHSETICEFATTFPFRETSLNWGLFGRSVRFESTAFNDRYKVRCIDSKFASDVFHPRQLEYVLHSVPPPFSLERDGRILLRNGKWLPDDIDQVSNFLHGFFARVPDFVWQDLGAWPRPIPALANYRA